MCYIFFFWTGERETLFFADIPGLSTITTDKTNGQLSKPERTVRSRGQYTYATLLALDDFNDVISE